MFSDNKFLYKNLFPKENGREINIYKLTDIKLVGQNLFYPNCFLNKSNDVINPTNEKIMSLEGVTTKIISYDNTVTDSVVTTPVFYFIYNTDNYYHFIYDTLPYLISYNFLKKEIPNIKLLMNYPNEGRNSFYPFVLEFLELLGIGDKDIVMVDNKTMYNQVFISSSYTHGIDSNLPPRKEIYELYTELALDVKYSSEHINTPKKIYISRRSWKHNNFSNIGTNYTTRRKMTNEDELVGLLESEGYVEVFTENMTTKEKIVMFANAEVVIGAIGGGLCNVLFSNPTTKVIPLISPTFLDVNKRFIYSFSKVNVKYFTDTNHTSNDTFKKYMRVKSNDLVGEIIEVLDDYIVINYSKNFVAGWNSQVMFETQKLEKKECTLLDCGLNSEWVLNINSFKEHLLNN